MRPLNQEELDRKWKHFEEELADKQKPQQYQHADGVKRMRLNRAGDREMPVWGCKVGDGPWEIDR